MTVTSAAVVGTVGGAGTTRLAVEVGAVLARAGRRALVLDLDFARQGLASRVPGRLSPDSTRLLADPAVDLAEATHPADIDVPGSLAYCPAHAPFTRVAEASSSDAAQRLEDRLDEAVELGYDAVLIDTPPIASNPAVASVTSTDRTVLVASPDERGVDAIQRARGRLADVGSAADRIVTTRTTPANAPPDADITIPTAPSTGPTGGPDALGATSFATAIAETAETLFETALGLELEDPGRVESIRRRLSSHD